MSIIINAVFPTIVLLTLGNIFRRRHFLPAEFWQAADKLTYFVLFPALIITKIAKVDLAVVSFSQVFGFIAIFFALMSLVSYGVYRATGTHINQLSSIYQGLIRFNSYVFFALIEALWGQQLLSLAALIAGIAIPTVNVCCIAVFAIGHSSVALSTTLLSMVKNPLILAAFLGFIVNRFPEVMPLFLFNSFDILATATLPLALLSVGAAVRIKMLFLKHEGFTRVSLWLTTVVRLMIAPLLAYLITQTLGVGEELQKVLIVFAAVPTATSSYILAKQLGGHADMMATIISLQTVFSMLTLTMWLFFLQ